MESSYPEPWHRHTPKGMSVVTTTSKSKNVVIVANAKQLLILINLWRLKPHLRNNYHLPSGQ